MELSIVIASWSAKDYLARCLRSFAEHPSRHSMEIIVVDNASVDGSPEMVEASFPDVRLIRNPRNMGFAKACNIGIGQSSGAYVCLVNSDVVLSDRSVDVMYEYMQQNPAVGMVGPRFVGPDGELQMSCKSFPTLWNHLMSWLTLDRLFPSSRLFAGRHMTWFSHDEVRRVDVLAGTFWMIRRKVLEDVGLLDDRFFFYCEDLDWCKRCWQAGWEVVFLPEAEIGHHHGASSKRQPVRFYVQQHRSALRYWRKHHHPVAVFIIAANMLLHQALRVLVYTCAGGRRRSAPPARRHKLERSVACVRWLLGMHRDGNDDQPEDEGTRDA